MTSAHAKSLAAAFMLISTALLGTPCLLAQNPQTDMSPVESRVVVAPNATTVAQLADILHDAHDRRDAELAKQLSRLCLTERLNSAKLGVLGDKMPGPKSKAALIALADKSAFLALPKQDIPELGVPDKTDRTRMLTLTVAYLKTTMPKLPNFYATRTTVSYLAIQNQHSPAKDAVSNDEEPMERVAESIATVLYRDGKEVVTKEKLKGKALGDEMGLITRGTFGPILLGVIVDAARGSLQWSHWEETPQGTMAVFAYRVPRSESHYKVGHFNTVDAAPDVSMDATAYHGEVGIDPGTGTILRLTMEADLDPTWPTHRADIMVEYGQVEIGGKRYTCPVKSVSISEGVAMIREDSMGVREKSEATRLNDVVFDNYHVFRSEMRILPN